MTAWDIGDEDIWRLAVLILELPKENSFQPGSKDSRYWLGLQEISRWFPIATRFPDPIASLPPGAFRK
jgi:hypothetical protein